METSEQSAVLRWAVLLAGITIFLGGLHWMSGLVASAALALVIAVGVAPVQQWMIDRKVPSVLAFVLTLIACLVVVVVVFGMLFISLASFVQTLPTYGPQVTQLVNQVTAALAKYGITVNSAKSSALNPTNLINAAKGIAAWFGGAANQFATVLILFVFMLLDSTGIRDKVERAYPGRSSGLGEFSDRMRKWVVLTTIVNAGVAIGNTVLLYLLQIPYALLWGILSFLLGFIPNVGFLLSLVPPTLLALLLYGWQKALIVVIAYIVINGAVSNIATPKLMGEGLNLSPFVIMFSLFFWAILLGPLGAILAVPLTLIAKLGLEQSPETKRVASLMEGTATGAAIPEEVAS